MSLPTKDTQHVTEGLALLTSQFTNKVTTRALLAAFLNRVQDIENVLWDVIHSQMLSTPPTGNALDQVGDLVGAKRSGFSDAQFLVFVRVAVAARLSGGRAEDLIGILSLVLATFDYQEWPPAAFDVTALNIDPTFVAPLAQALKIARDPGVYGVFDHSTWAPALDMVFGSTIGPVAGRGFSDATSPAYPFKIISALQV